VCGDLNTRPHDSISPCGLVGVIRQQPSAGVLTSKNRCNRSAASHERQVVLMHAEFRAATESALFEWSKVKLPHPHDEAFDH
jgi:hypothetical protein